MKSIILFFFMIFFFPKEANNATTENKFTTRLVSNNFNWAEFIYPTKSEDGFLYIVTGETDPNNNNPNRYIIKYNINSATYIETFSYKSDCPFNFAESYIIGDNSQYLLMTSFLGEPSYQALILF